MNQKKLAMSAVIAAMYVALVYAGAPLASGAIQFRVAEALTILPIFTTAGIYGVTVGCFLANLLTGCAALDVVFGTLATLIGVVGTRLLRKYRVLPLLPPILSNMLIVPWVLRYAYGLEDAYLYLAFTVGIGEVVCVGILGWILRSFIEKNPALKAQMK